MRKNICAVIVLTSATGFAFDIRLDYTYDDYFSNPSNPYGPTAQAALEAAAGELSGLITNSLGAITDDVITGVNGNTSATFTTSYNFVDPRNSDLVINRSPLGVGSDEIVLYVGAQSMGAFTFAEASPGTPSLQLGGSGFGNNWQGAISNAETAMNQVFGRGNYDMQRISGSAALDGTVANYNLNFGPVMGSMWFNDSPGDVSSGRESWETNNDYWHFDHTTDVGTGKIDIYSIALHEIMHVLGYGVGESWQDNVNGNDWLGPEAAALLGTGEDILHDDGRHIESGLLSPGYADGVLRQTVMNRSPQVGQRDQITLLDLAFLSDTGYEIAPIPEPRVGLLLGLLAAFAFRRER